MTAAPLIIVLVAAGEGQSPATQALLASANQALDQRAATVVREQAERPDDLIATLRKSQAAAAVRVSWLGAAHLRARVRVRVAGADDERGREVAFGAEDDEAERGRALGFTIASMLPDAGLSMPTRGSEATAPAPGTPDQTRHPTPAPPRSREEPAPVASGPSPPVPADAADDRPPQPAPTKETEEPANPAPTQESLAVAGAAPSAPVPWRRRWTLTVGLAGSTGIEGPAGGLGGTARVGLDVIPSLAAQAGAKVLGRDVDDLPGDLVTATVAGGLSWRPTDRSGPDGASRVGLGLRADLLGVLQSASRTATSGTSWQHRFTPGADLMVELDFAVHPGVWLVASAGAEVLVGPTDLWIGKRRVTTIPTLRLASELAVRFDL